VWGFTIFFVGFGLITAKFSQELNDLGIDIPTILTRLGGVAVILFGLYVMKLLDPVFRQGLRLAEYMKENPPFGYLFSFTAVVVLLAYLFWAFDTYEQGSVLSVVLPLGLLLMIVALFRNALTQAESIGDFWTRAINSLQYALVTDTRRLEAQSGSGGFFGSLAMGIVFAAGWTPCIGPIYGSVLNLAASSAVNDESLLPAAEMLTAYSMGLGIPFLVMALGLNQMSGVMKGLKRNMRKVEYASGALLILIGVLILSGRLEEFSRQFGNEGELGELSTNLEACSVGVATGRINVGTWTDCVGGGSPKLNDRIVFASVAKTFTQALAIPDLALATTDTAAEEDRLFTVDPNFDYEAVDVGLNVGDLAPGFTTVTPGGEAVSLEDFRGDIVVLNFWATWCGPCQREMPEFQNIYDELNPRGFSILAIDFLEGPEPVAAFAEELNLNFPIVMDESGAINDMYRIGQYPSSFVVDGHGVIVARHAGILGGAQVLEIIESIDG
jgi:cytochrome c biogenesis protein CcdA/peroxiredoxin